MTKLTFFCSITVVLFLMSIKSQINLIDKIKYNNLINNVIDSNVINSNVINSNVILNLKKNSEGVLVSYPPKCSLQIRHPLYSDVIFPEKSTVLITNNKSTLSNYFSSGDSIYLLPLIGISNNLHLYSINFGECKLSSNNYDIRTVLPFVWVDVNTNRFIVAELKNVEDRFMYNFITYKIHSDEVLRLDSKILEFDGDLYDDFEKQDSICKSLFKN